MSGGGWWSGESGAMGVWMYLLPPPQTSVSALKDRQQTWLHKKQQPELTDMDLNHCCTITVLSYGKKEGKSTNKAENIRARGHSNAHHFLSNPVAGL